MRLISLMIATTFVLVSCRMSNVFSTSKGRDGNVGSDYVTEFFTHHICNNRVRSVIAFFSVI